MSYIEAHYNMLPDWVENFGGQDIPTPFIPPKKRITPPEYTRRYEMSWEVPFGTRKIWIIGAKNAVAIREFIREGDIFNIQINRLNDSVLVPSNNMHRHWVNDIELDHHWDICDVNPKNFLYFT